jgi:hypothetical protein
MKGIRVVIGSLAALVAAAGFIVVPATYAAPNDPDPKAAGEHITYVYCHRTGSASNPFVVIGTDDAAWAEAHITGVDPAHPPQNGNDDVLIAFGVGLSAKDFSEDDCEKK